MALSYVFKIKKLDWYERPDPVNFQGLYFYWQCQN